MFINQGCRAQIKLAAWFFQKSLSEARSTFHLFIPYLSFYVQFIPQRNEPRNVIPKGFFFLILGPSL